MKGFKFSFSNISTVLLGVFVLLMLFNPNVKGWFIEKLMYVGLFQPDVAAESKPVVPLTSDILFKDANGKTLSLSALKGKVVFVNLWATWCPPCIGELPSINALYGKFKSSDNVIFITADVDGDLSRTIKFMKKKQLDLPLFILAGDVPENIFTGTIPTTFILNKQGQIVYRHEGAADYSSPKVEKLLHELVAAK